jgi:hypothetical protein
MNLTLLTLINKHKDVEDIVKTIPPDGEEN